MSDRSPTCSCVAAFVLLAMVNLGSEGYQRYGWVGMVVGIVLAVPATGLLVVLGAWLLGHRTRR